MRRNGVDNELNLGLGLNYTIHEDERGIQFAEAGFYRDSGSHLAKLAGMGLPVQARQPLELNAIYAPRYGDYNPFAVFGFYFSVPLAR